MLLLPSPAIFAMTAGHSRILRTVPVGRGLSGVCMHGSRGHCDVWEDPELQGCTRMLLPTKRVGVLERPNPSATLSGVEILRVGNSTGNSTDQKRRWRSRGCTPGTPKPLPPKMPLQHPQLNASHHYNSISVREGISTAHMSLASGFTGRSL